MPYLIARIWMFCSAFLVANGKGHLSHTSEMSGKDHCLICNSHFSSHHRQSHQYSQTTNTAHLYHCLHRLKTSASCAICAMLGTTGCVCFFTHLSSPLVWGSRSWRVWPYTFRRVAAQSQKSLFMASCCKLWCGEALWSSFSTSFRMSWITNESSSAKSSKRNMQVEEVEKEKIASIL